MKKLKEYIQKNSLTYPNYEQEISIIDLMKCLYSRYGYEIEKTQKIEELDLIIPINKHYLFILSDGTGTNIIDKLDKNSILKNNLKSKLVTVFPSTTGCVLTSLVTAQYPEEHGIWGWFNYDRNLKKDYFPLLFADRKSKKSLEEFSIKSDDIYKSKSVLKSLSINTNILYPDYICNSVYSQFVGNDENRIPYKDYTEIIDIVNDITKKEEPTYTYLYISDVDTIEHEAGPNSEQALDKLKEIDKMVKEIVKNPDLTIVFTADHGQTSVEEDIILDFNKYEKYFYAYPSIDFGTASYYIKSEYKEEFEKEFEKDFANKMVLFETKDFIKEKLFGPQGVENTSTANLGEYISLCEKGTYLINNPDITPYYGKIKGNHSGLSKDEMEIPLIIIDNNNF